MNECSAVLAITAFVVATDVGRGGQVVQGTGVGSSLRVTVLDQTDAAGHRHGHDRRCARGETTVAVKIAASPSSRT